MKQLLTLFLLLAAALTSQAGRIKTDTIESKVLGEKVVYNIYLPNGFERSTKQYPVVYLLHGLTDDYRAWRDRGRMQDVADELIESGDACEMIIDECDLAAHLFSFLLKCIQNQYKEGMSEAPSAFLLIDDSEPYGFLIIKYCLSAFAVLHHISAFHYTRDRK